MIRGTTPEHIFTLPLDASVLKTVRVIYSNGAQTLVKTGEDCVVEGNTVRVRLTQEETLGFRANSYVDVQVRVLTQGGDALASNIQKVPVRRLLEDEVIA